MFVDLIWQLKVPTTLYRRPVYRLGDAWKAQIGLPTFRFADREKCSTVPEFCLIRRSLCSSMDSRPRPVRHLRRTAERRPATAPQMRRKTSSPSCNQVESSPLLRTDNIRPVPERKDRRPRRIVVIVDHTLLGTPGFYPFLPGSRSIEHRHRHQRPGGTPSPLDGLDICVHSYQELTVNRPPLYRVGPTRRERPGCHVSTFGHHRDQRSVYSQQPPYLHALSSLPDALRL